MPERYKKSFISKDALTGEPVTLVVEYVEAKGFKGISIESLTGEYSSPEEFEQAYNASALAGYSSPEEYEQALKDFKKNVKNEDIKIYNFLPMTLKTATILRDVLNKAITASRA